MASHDDSASSSSDEFGYDGPARAFWAVELVPGKEFSTSLPFDLRITQAVLPASAKDTGRTVVNIAFADEPEKTFALASLKLDNNDSQSIDITLDGGSEFTLTVVGKNSVHLSGAYQPDASDDDDMYPPGYGSDDGEEFDEEGESDNSSVDDEIEALALAEQQKRKALAQQNGGNAKKPKVDAVAQQKPKDEVVAQQKPKEATPQQQKPKEATPQQQKPKAEGTPNKPQQQPKQAQQQKSPAQQQTKEFPNGLQITTVQAGTGAEAVKGKMVAVKYIGRLTKNGKVFDASKKPFSFKLGKGDVIAGWDQGVAGMRVGEKRKLVIPSALGYGPSGAPPDIPPHASLTFDVELLKVN